MVKQADGLFHMDIKLHGRSRGADVAKLMAYRAGSSMVSSLTGRRHTYSRKQEVAYSAVVLPPGAPSEWNDRRKLAYAIESGESRRKDGQLVREIEVALPRELSFDQQVSLLHHFIRRTFVNAGMIASLDIHSKPGNPHCHILLTLRAVTPDGFGQKVRGWNEHSLAESWRKRWARACNAALSLAGSTTRLDHRSYARRGLDITPTRHLGTRRDGFTSKWDARSQDNELIMGQRLIRQSRTRVRQLEKALEQNKMELLDAALQAGKDALAMESPRRGPTPRKPRQRANETHNVSGSFKSGDSPKA